MPDWESVIKEEWKKRSKPTQKPGLFPLISQSYDEDEVIAAVDSLLTGQLTMGQSVREFEETFSRTIGAPYSVMVNSGSSANLLALAVACNPQRKKHLRKGDEILVPSVCWSTSVWPIVQLGMTPVFVDVDPKTLNVSLEDLERKLSKRTRGLVAVHILGNSAPVNELVHFAKSNDLILLEDTCESLGSKSQNKFLGTFGDFGTFSFYYSHHITTGEGGMVSCQSLEDYDLLKCLRAHGWSRELSDRKSIEGANPDVDPRFLFVNVGYNLRPMEIQATFGLRQLAKLPKMNGHRNKNFSNLISSLQSHKKWKNQFQFVAAAPGTEPAWFGFPCLLTESFKENKRAFLNYLSENGVENRPIVSGNFARQPGLKLFDINVDPKDYPGAELVNHAGFFIGLHTELLSFELIKQLTDILLSFDFREGHQS